MSAEPRAVSTPRGWEGLAGEAKDGDEAEVVAVAVEVVATPSVASTNPTLRPKLLTRCSITCLDWLAPQVRV